MIRVIDTIRFDERALQNDPEFMENVGPGLQVILDLEQGPPFLFKPGSTVRVHRPDGASFDRTVTAIEVWGVHVGLFFEKTVRHEIPKSSEIELLA